MCKVCTEADRFKQNPAAGQIFRNRPAGQITPNRPAGQITPNRPVGQITLNRPAGQSAEDRPAGQTGWLAGIKIVNEIRVQWHNTVAGDTSILTQLQSTKNLYTYFIQSPPSIPKNKGMNPNLLHLFDAFWTHLFGPPTLWQSRASMESWKAMIPGIIMKIIMNDIIYTL